MNFKILPAAVVFLIAFLSGCSLSDQIKSRQLLEKCTYDLKHVEVEKIDFDNIIQLVGSAKEIDFKNPNKKEIKPISKEIKELKFDLNFKTLDLVGTLEVTNPNSHEVILDSLYFDAHLDDTYVAQVIHDGTLYIPANSKGEMDLIFSLPTRYKLKKVLDAENVVFKGKVWLKLELVKGIPITIPLPFNVKQKVPKGQIQKSIDEQKEKIKKKILKEIGQDKLKKVLDKF